MARNLSSPTNPLKKLLQGDTQEDLFRALADRLEQAVLVFDPDATRVLTCNHALLLLTGFTRPELETMRASDLLQGEPGARVLAALAELEPGSSYTAQEVPFLSRDSNPIFVDLEAAHVGSEGTPLLLTARRSQDRRRQEERHGSHQSRLDALAAVADSMLGGGIGQLGIALEAARAPLGASALGVYRVSPNKPDYILDGALPDTFPGSLPSSEIKDTNRSSRWAIGERPEGPLAKAARAAGAGALLSSPIGGRNAWVGVLVALWNEADDVPEQAGDLLSVVASLCHAAIQLGMQEASSAEMGAALKGLQAEASGQLNAVSDAVIGLDSELRIVRLNASARKLLGYDHDEIKGLSVQDVLVGPEDITSTLLDALGHERTAERPKIVLHRRDGTPFPVHLRAVPMGRASPTRLLVVLSDQTEQQAIEDQNELLAQRALLGEVSAIFAHEVRNPINNISTGIQLVASRLGKDHPMYGSLDRVRKECTRLDQLMSDVLFFTRRLELKMEPIDMGETLKRMLERWRPRMEQAGVRSHVTLDPDTPEVLADPRTFEQVIINLITNALQAMSDGGTLSVTLQPAESNHEAAVELKIADTGPGISQEQMDRIFDPFFTTKKDGTGLGLAISRRIITAHKGSVNVESFPDAGTVFTIHLPAAEQQEEEATA